METQRRITCKLCLKVFDDFKAIEKDLKGALEILLPEIDSSTIQTPVMCTNCVNLLLKCSDFKATCLSTHNFIVPFISKDKADSKLDLKDVYLSKNATGAGVLKDQDICGLCMGLVKAGSAINLDIERGDETMKHMIERCLPELDFSVIKKPLICSPCRGFLESCFRLISNYSIAEEKVKRYCKTPNVDSKDEIDLPRVSEFTMRNVKDGNLAGRIKVEPQFGEDTESPDKTEIGYGGNINEREKMFFDDWEQASEDVKIKNESSTEIADHVQVTPKNTLVPKGENNKLDFIKTEGLFYEGNDNEQKAHNLVMENRKCVLHEEIEIKTDDHHLEGLGDSTSLPGQKCLTSDLEGDETTYIEESLLNKNVSCLYQTKRKDSLKEHFLKHKDSSELIMYKCSLCSFQTRFKKRLKPHTLLHKDPSDVTMYKCDSCLYRTKFKSTLKLHLLRHKDSSEVTMYKCDSCVYQTKYKKCLNRHSLRHMFEDNLKLHLSRDRDPSDVSMHRCNFCFYQTKHKHNFNRHLVMHKDPSEVTMYKCDDCLYQTRFKDCLKNHLLNHKNIKLYKCDLCSYQGNHKGSLHKHLLRHKKGPSQVIV